MIARKVQKILDTQCYISKFQINPFKASLRLVNQDFNKQFSPVV